MNAEQIVRFAAAPLWAPGGAVVLAKDPQPGTGIIAAPLYTLPLLVGAMFFGGRVFKAYALLSYVIAGALAVRRSPQAPARRAANPQGRAIPHMTLRGRR